MQSIIIISHQEKI